MCIRDSFNVVFACLTRRRKLCAHTCFHFRNGVKRIFCNVDHCKHLTRGEQEVWCKNCLLYTSPEPTRQAEGRPLYRAGLSKDDLELLAPHFLLTTRQVLAVVNVAEDALDTIPEMEARVRAELAPPGSASEHNIEVLGMSVQLEAEAAQLTGQDRIDTVSYTHLTLPTKRIV